MLGIQWNNITQNLFNAKNLLKCNITKINLMLKSDKKKITQNLLVLDEQMK